MLADAPKVREAFKTLDVSVGDRKRWCQSGQLPYVEGDPDVVAYDTHKKRCVVAEVEGASSRQPEQKLYKAIGKMVRTVSNLPPGWNSHLKHAHALAKLGISGLALADDPCADRWLFGEPLWMGGGIAGRSR